MILPDYDLIAWGIGGGIDPFDPKNVNPASLDLVLGGNIKVPLWYWNPVTRWVAWHILGKPDPKSYPEKYWAEAVPFKRFVLWPGRFVLCHSEEFTTLPADVAAFLISKSTTGRIGLEHLHAGFGDPGFSGQWTWELVNLSPWPIELVPGQRLVQLVLMPMKGQSLQKYKDTGRYQGQRGATSAKIKQE